MCLWNDWYVISPPFIYLSLTFCRAKDALRQCLPNALRDQSFAKVLNNEEAVLRWLSTLARNIAPGDDSTVGSGAGAGAGAAEEAGAGAGGLSIGAAGTGAGAGTGLSALSSLGGAGDGKGFGMSGGGSIGGANWNTSS
jgi:hypothetical protein